MPDDTRPVLLTEAEVMTLVTLCLGARVAFARQGVEPAAAALSAEDKLAEALEAFGRPDA